MGKLVGVILVIVVAVAGYMFLQRDTDTAPTKTAKKAAAQPTLSGPVKTFTTTAFYDETGVWYSLKEMRVKKGDTVRIKATNTKGTHDFTLDEFGVKTELPINQEVTIEFQADKVGEFTYYCSKLGHRAKGQFGKLIVE
ncbi:MAG: cupredoxin domain-containing protein [Candidatus Moranbacteria bacterium]|nr:cupredoxin domain-containing protein [Candidatus Moranbacteria bacterium]